MHVRLSTPQPESRTQLEALGALCVRAVAYVINAYVTRVYESSPSPVTSIGYSIQRQRISEVCTQRINVNRARSSRHVPTPQLTRPLLAYSLTSAVSRYRSHARISKLAASSPDAQVGRRTPPLPRAPSSGHQVRNAEMAQVSLPTQAIPLRWTAQGPDERRGSERGPALCDTRCWRYSTACRPHPAITTASQSRAALAPTQPEASQQQGLQGERESIPSFLQTCKVCASAPTSNSLSTDARQAA